MTRKQQINHGAIQSVCHFHNGIIYSINYVTLCQFYTLSPPLCYSLKLTNYGMREKRIFCIYDYYSESRYIKRSRKSYL